MSTTPSTDKIPIPEYWRDETQQSIENGVLDDESRSDITRTLVTLLTVKYGPRPGKSRCQDLARQLILKYPFMKDDMGSGYVSPTKLPVIKVQQGIVITLYTQTFASAILDFLNFSKTHSVGMPPQRFTDNPFCVYMQASWVFKIQECIDNRIKQSKRKQKKQSGEASPNTKRKRVCFPRDELMSRSDF